MAPKPQGWPERVRNFTPSWYSITMGTGILPILLLNFPFHTDSPVLHDFALAFWALNIVLFVFFTVMTMLRYWLYPEVFKLMLQHPTQSLFLGTVPMGFATIVSGAAGLWGEREWVSWLCAGLWWVDVVMSLGTAVGLVFYIMSKHSHSLHTTTAVLLLPIVPLIVAASSATTFAAHLPHSQTLVLLTVGFLLWSAGIMLSISLLAIYFFRLLAYPLPSRDVIISCFLPVGPFGQGAFFILRFGSLLSSSLTLHPPSSLAPAIIPALSSGILYLTRGITLFLFAVGTYYLLFALLSVAFTFPRKFNVGMWGCTFPLGTWALAASALGNETGWEAFRVLGAVGTTVVGVFWGGCAVGTCWKGFWEGEMFVAPCLQGWSPGGSSRSSESESDGKPEEESAGVLP